MQIPADIAHLSNSEIARRLNVSPTAVMYARREALGLCRRCAKPALPAGTALCAKHRDLVNRADRKRKGYKPWKPGKRGRPPFSAQLQNLPETQPGAQL